MFRTLAFILLWLTGTLLCFVIGSIPMEGVATYVLPWLFPNLKKRYFEDVAVPPVLFAAAITGFLLAGKLLRVNYGKLRSVPNDVAKQMASFRSERTVVRLFYIILYGIPNGFYVLMTTLGAGRTKSGGDPSGMGDGLDYLFMVVVFPVFFNLAIMILSLLATPIIRRLSTASWAQSHVRNSLVIPIVAVMLIWLAAGFSVYLSSWVRLLRS